MVIGAGGGTGRGMHVVALVDNDAEDAKEGRREAIFSRYSRK